MPSTEANYILLYVTGLLPFYNTINLNSIGFVYQSQPIIETWLRPVYYSVCMEDRTGLNYHSFLLRLWRVRRNGEPKERASLENVENGEKRGFISLEDLLAYLAEITSAWDETSAEGNGSEARE